MDRTLIKASSLLAIALLLCVFPMPYGYYVLVRFATMIIMVCLAFNFYKAAKTPLAIVAASLAILFQPFAKVALGRDVWNVVDVIVAIGLLLLSWQYRSNKDEA